MKSLFTRDSKKKKEKLQQQQHQNMVREESLRARYVEYKGRDNEPKYKKKEMNDENSVSTCRFYLYFRVTNCLEL